jgi:fructose-specific phosphotransferase system IIC component
VCLDPRSPIPVPQGNYLGTLSVGGPGITPATVAVSATLAHSNKGLAFFVAVLGALAGLLAKFLSDNRKFLTDWKYYLTATLVAVIAAVGTGYIASYAKNPIFGENLADWVALFAVGFAAVVTGVTAIDALGKAAGQSPK